MTKIAVILTWSGGQGVETMIDVTTGEIIDSLGNPMTEDEFRTKVPGWAKEIGDDIGVEYVHTVVFINGVQFTGY